MEIYRSLENAIPNFLHETAIALSQWLQRALQAESKDWWEQFVLPSLSYSQLQRINMEHITDLQALDFSALLRIMDKNWYTLLNKHDIDNETRNYLKELQQIRNKWAHLDSRGSADDDSFRALDTIIRFGKKILPDAEFLTEAQTIKDNYFHGAIKNMETHAANTNKVNTKFSRGDIVRLKSNPEKQGAVCQVFPQAGENRYIVLLGGKKGSYYESQLEACPEENSQELKPLEYIHRFITALQLEHPSTDLLYSLNAARIEFVPYQFRPVLKFIHSDRPRLLIADGVGVGKTIEAGLIMRELQARNSANTVLILCPKSLVAEHKWDNEMKRFDESFEILNGDQMRHCIDECRNNGRWLAKHSKCIVPYSVLDERFLIGQKKEVGYANLSPQPHWDLVIVDEAHHIRNTNTQAYEAVNTICNNADAVIFLTATPIQMDNQELFNLLAILRPDMVRDRASFMHIMEPNGYINQAIQAVRRQSEGWNETALSELAQARQTDYGKDFYRNNRIFDAAEMLLQKQSLAPDERVTLLSLLEQLHTLYGLISRTRRKDIGDFTIRNPFTVEIEFTAEQQELYAKLLEFERKALSVLHDGTNTEFMMSTLKRQAASSIFGLEPLIDDIINRRADALQDIFIEKAKDLDNKIFDEFAALANEIKNGIQAVSSEDRKFDALMKIIEKKSIMPNNKLMIFSSFRHTLFYLHKRLRQNGVRAEIIHGGVKDEERRQIRSRFELASDTPDALDVLLFSDVGCEGLDYQFCDTMVNYDLPWNPQRIEQRIGRIDRRGQKSEKILIYNLITQGTIDAVIFLRCLSRIGVFERSIGECDSILGGIQKSIENIIQNNNLTADERAAKLEQLADNQRREQEERIRLEEDSCELFGIKIHQNQLNDELSQADSFWLRPDALLDLVKAYLETFGVHADTAIIGSEPLKALRLSAEIRRKMKDDLLSCKLSDNLRNAEWRSYLEGAEPLCKITFDKKTAAENPKCFFINPVHPFVKAAVKRVLPSPTPYTVIQVDSDEIASGSYPFVLCSLEYSGLQTALKIIPVCADQTVQKNFFNLLEQGCFLDAPELLPPQETFDELDAIQHQLWSAEKIQYQQLSENIFQRKSSTLAASFNARKAMCQEQMEKAKSQKIIAMKQGQIKNMEADYQHQLEILNREKKASDIAANSIVFGVLVVK